MKLNSGFSYSILICCFFISSCGSINFHHRKYTGGRYNETSSEIKKTDFKSSFSIEKNTGSEVEAKKSPLIDESIPFSSELRKSGRAGMSYNPAVDEKYLEENKLILFQDIVSLELMSSDNSFPANSDSFNLLGFLELISFLCIPAAIVLFFLGNPIYIFFLGGAIVLYLFVKIASWLRDD